MGYKVLHEGEQGIVVNDHGQPRLVIGPRRLWIGVNETFELLARYEANQFQYLVVKYRDGRKEHMKGPIEMFWNKLEIESIYLRDCVKIDANHLLVVYRQEEGHIERRIIKGPTVFLPSAHEWIHDFVWHGSDIRNPAHWSPQKWKFQQLCHVPSQAYFDVKDVRTNDDTLITVKLMLFYELVDVETMLNYTHDPIADFINAVSSDMVAFASKLTYQDFLHQTNQLNVLESYSQLTSRAQRIGYRITKVVYRGYAASSSLQATHDDAVQNRTYLRLETEAEESRQKLEEFKLKREKERTKLKQEMEKKNQEHMQELESLRQKSSIDKKSLEHNAKLKKQEAELEMQLEVEKAENEMRQEFLRGLKDLGVDMSRYLICRQPEFAPDKEVIVGPATQIVARPSAEI